MCTSSEEFQALVDQNLRADSGMDLQGFAHFVAVAAASELSALRHMLGNDQHHTEKSSLQSLGLESEAACRWHSFCLRRALEVLVSVAEEAQAVGANERYECNLAHLHSLSMQQLVQGIGCLEDNSQEGHVAHFRCFPYLAELIKRLRDALELKSL